MTIPSGLLGQTAFSQGQAGQSMTQAAGMFGSVGSTIDMLGAANTPVGFNESYSPPDWMMYSDAGADLAIMSGNPIAMGGGLAYKGAKAVTGDFGKKDEFAEKQKMARNNAFSERTRKAQDVQMSNFNVNPMPGDMYEYGGYMPSYEMGGMMEVKGPSHAQGGVVADFNGDGVPEELEGGEVIMDNYVFSKKLGFASRAKRLHNRNRKTIEKGKTSPDPITKNTAMRQQLANDLALADLRDEQELVRYEKGLA